MQFGKIGACSLMKSINVQNWEAMAAPGTGGTKQKILGNAIFYTRKRPFTNMERQYYLKGRPTTNLWLRKGSLKTLAVHLKKYVAKILLLSQHFLIEFRRNKKLILPRTGRGDVSPQSLRGAAPDRGT